MDNSGFTISWRIQSLVCVFFCIFSVGCTSIDERLFSLKDFPEGDEAEKQFPTFHLKTGQKVIYLPGKSDAPVILYSYGSREWLRKNRVQKHIEAFQEHGYSVIAYEYSGYGKEARGKTTVQNVCKDIEVVYQYLTVEKKFSPKKIILFGYSVGTGPTCYLASKFPVGGIVLIAPFASAAQVVLPFSIPFVDEFPNAEILESCEAPLLLYHGIHDPKIPYRNGLKVYEKAKGPKTMVSIPDMTSIKSTSPLDTDHVKIFEAVQDRFWLDLRACFPYAHQ